MWSLFRLLFSKSYWRTLMGGHTWRESGVAFRRAHKDKRARKRLWAMLCLILLPFFCVFWLAWVVASGAGLIGGVIALVMMGLVSGTGVASRWRRTGRRRSRSRRTRR